ncbi:MAG: restriction endonuclease [Candidatus Pacebacteria bacterium]|nr:restriction endonuclease [Candidatus Paceibacterota bacterium]
MVAIIQDGERHRVEEDQVTAESVAFEQLIARIQSVEIQAGVTVKHNADLPDPDSPSNKRQIDVLIEHKGLKTSVECRDRSGTQSVMWIEELIGRKQSLGLDGMIAVAVNGFSKLAQVKAKRYGIQLYDFKDLTDVEIATWGEIATVEVTFIQFDMLLITAFVELSDEPKLNEYPTMTFNGGDGCAAIIDYIRDDAAANPNVTRVLRVPAGGFQLDSVPVSELVVGFSAKLSVEQADCTSARCYGAPGESAALRSTSVQKFEHTVEEMIIAGDQVAMSVNVERLKVPDNSMLHTFAVRFSDIKTVTKYELVGNGRMVSQINRTRIDVVGW